MASSQYYFFVIMAVAANIWSSDAKPLIDQLSLIDSNLTYNNGNYSFSYDNGNGKAIVGTGSLDNLDRSVSGTFNYTSPEGQVESLSWSAGKGGFKFNFSIIRDASLGDKAGVFPRGRRAAETGVRLGTETGAAVPANE